ncbi:asparagine synthase (glutamine-hydrolyzing) [Marinobacterium sediminicola]|uniref:asparagine synthase (glutamine-hydrolyzing) n=1 Tax=Marinobacterium sediminicola TaxID=518898 RepID=A0ABY1RZP8_9GAMM|nr:asparagine synthase (glutamine-hydrolyzing) [Marinobacterium sediminicola]ULG69098.1 asparagine synthase (glutamine-hydrolyzing) [Marinobacterium sediminicola]SMR73624.1 asparagine synthase (glutamine-hydrolysing) [Marinobacterium sediminicola]
MCGIAGIYTPGRDIEGSLCSQLAKALSHRGPDGQGLFSEHGIALIHTRLSIIDLENGQQPLYSSDHRQVLVANGEIYNHVELRQTLAERGGEFSTKSDCEVIVSLAGNTTDAGFANQLEGMFAFALFNRDKGELLLVRDRLGIKPLYYCEVSGGIAFASEIKALIGVLPERPRPNLEAVGRFLQINFASGENTAVQGIRRIPPGGFLKVSPDGCIESGLWWSLEEALQEQPAFEGDEVAALTKFDQLMKDVLQKHLRSDVPVGLFLSGGIDSSILATELSRCRFDEEFPKAWSLAFPGSSVHDESESAGAVAGACSLELECVKSEPIELFDHLVYAVWASDELMGDFASLPTLMLADRAAQSHKVVLSGEGGDEVFAGYGRYRMTPLQQWMARLRAPGSGGFRTKGRFNRPQSLCLIQSSQRSNLFEHWRTPFVNSWKRFASFDRLTRMQATDITTWLVDDLLVKADRMMMVKGVEGRVPFLDHRLVLFGLSLPVALKHRGRLGKYLLRKWLKTHLPEVTQGRKKGFSVPVVDWVRSLDPLRLEQALMRSPLLVDIVAHKELRSLLVALPKLDKKLVEPIAALLQLAIWHRLFIEGSGEKPPEKVDPLEWLLS